MLRGAARLVYVVRDLSFERFRDFGGQSILPGHLIYLLYPAYKALRAVTGRSCEAKVVSSVNSYYNMKGSDIVKLELPRCWHV